MFLAPSYLMDLLLTSSDENLLESVYRIIDEADRMCDLPPASGASYRGHAML
jgi:hypothetical protein